jgi:allophanate hydrolase
LSRHFDLIGGGLFFSRPQVLGRAEHSLSETIAEIVKAHRNGVARPADTVRRSFARIRERGDAAIFISLRDEAAAIADAEALAASSGFEGRPLYGVPVAIKDNIDVEGMQTTAGCPAFKYAPDRDATVVTRLRRAGAIVIGKTNLDQFATGLVGVRSPYGVPRNAVKPDLVPGGSSSGSAVAVAAGLVPLALGTDTAGSGRVPAALNNIVGLKPSLGLISNAGVVPACRSLDCVSIFALTTDDAWTALSAIAGPDPADPYLRDRPLGLLGAFPTDVRLGAPPEGQCIFFGDEQSARGYREALKRCSALGARIVEIDIAPFYEAARLLYEGPWVAERYLAVRALIESMPDALHPVTRTIIEQGRQSSALDAFSAFYRLEALRRVRDECFRYVDALLLPTIPTVYTVEQVLADPVELNSRLGTYTNFVNLLDMCGIALPSTMHDNGVPFGISVLAPGGQDALAASIARVLHADSALPLGALGVAQPPLTPLPHIPAAGEIAIAVAGAHLSGMPLNGELRALGAHLLETVSTAPDYLLYALVGDGAAKPGLLRVRQGTGAAIEVEIWALPVDGFGRFVAAVPPPMAIGTLRLADGRSVKGFLVEPEGAAGCRDISSFGGWRAYLAQAQTTAA